MLENNENIYHIFPHSYIIVEGFRGFAVGLYKESM